MYKSESIQNIAKALIAFHLKVDNIKKDAKNPFFKSAYASLSNILESTNDALIESGLAFTQFPTDENGLTTILMHPESGEYLEGTYEMKPVKDDPQGRGSVITYQRRYALAAILGLNIEDDDDANIATHGGKTPEHAQENNLSWLNKTNKDGSFTDEWNKVVIAMRSGKYTLSQVQSKFKLSKSIKAELEAILNEGVIN